MPSNVEIKARVQDWNKIKKLIKKLSDTPCQILKQEDIFFKCPKGRLKLRVFSSNSGQLIFYNRTNTKGPKQSRYLIFDTSDPQNLKKLLALAYPISITVKKKRFLYLVGQTRIHLDNVEKLGKFVELEVVLKPKQTSKEGYQIAKKLMSKFQIKSKDLISHAYADLLLKQVNL